MTRYPDPQAVASTIREVALSEALPRFKRLQAHEISEKRPGDLLTVADEATERALEARLADLMPGSLVVGEEAVSRDAGVLGALESEAPCWVVDPIDGTINFAGGLPLFATMVALVHHGETVGAWIYDPVHDVMALAERGAGTALDGQPVRLDPPADPKRLSGCLHLSGYDRVLAARAAHNFDAVGPLLVLHCAGLEYQAMLGGRLHYALYRHTNPWDHAPGQLLLAEAGGYSACLDGSAYEIGVIRPQWPLLAAAGEEAWHTVRRLLFEWPEGAR
ncbi:MAG TPA: inositol monophosphatase [Alphaproteobacteria bacterium]|nr:inositol monophosphatase [Alphaproteobacteria bacterium]